MTFSVTKKLNHKKVIVTTTINTPTDAIDRFATMEGWQLVIVGDLKTPSDFYVPSAVYLSPEIQESAYPALSELIGWNSIQRRNFGFLWALEVGAEIVATVDDDNIPIEGWGENLLLGKTITMPQYSGNDVYDPLVVTNYPQLWHRGFPIQNLQDRAYSKEVREISADIEAAFWNGDPDIDAICRMEHSPECRFDATNFPFSFDGFSPFNSQNTFLTRNALYSYCMIPHIGRMDDIWGGYFVQAQGSRCVYTEASVYQRRNPHDLTLDFEREILGYTQTHKLIKRLKEVGPEAIHDFLPERASACLREYLKISSSL
jgi:hypothetical protein